MSNGFEKYGHFSEDGREFIINRMDTPRPWINYAWSDHLLVNIDQRGSGGNLYRDEAGNRSVAIRDRFVYLKDLETGGFWTIGWGAIRLAGESYTCCHGLGYTRLVCNHLDWQAEWTISATPDSTEVWMLEVRNIGSKKRKVAIYAGVDFELGGWIPYGTLENYACTSILGNQLIFAQNRSDERPGVRNNGFFAASQTAAGYETSMREFLGGHYGSWSNPHGINNARLGCHLAMNEDLIGIFEYQLELESGVTWVSFFSNSSCFDQENAVHLSKNAEKHTFEEAVAYAKTRTECFDRLDFELPDSDWSRFFNIWSKQQLMLLKDFARVFLIGFRDSLQDAASIVAYAPELAAESIKRTLKYQFADGSALRGWCPVDDHKYGDSGVWIVLAVAEYLRETADYAFLDEIQIYQDGGQGTIWDHLVKSLEWFQENLGDHNLPKLYFGDWNDSLNIGRAGKGESIWLAMALVVANNDAAAIAMHTGRMSEYERFSKDAQVMRKNIEEIGWDGAWYRRGFTDAGEIVGGIDSPAGYIFSEPQSWAVMAGLDPERLNLLVQSVDERLRTSNGLLVCNPPFTQYDPAYGRISCILPGWGENGSCYCHVTAFQAVADAMMRDGERAYRSLASIMPFNPQLSVEISGLEPYAFSNMFRGPGNIRGGETFKGWTSGTVPWALRGMTHYLLGVRPDFDVLIVDPVMPKAWDKISFFRNFREANLEILINNPLHLESQKSQNCLILDGEYLDSVRIPVSLLTRGKHKLIVNVEPVSFAPGL